jgi:hypothetical protein
MTKNYSGSTKFREKSSMHMRHKNYSKIFFFRLRISRTKTNLSAKSQTQQNSGKNIPTYKPERNPS